MLLKYVAAKNELTIAEAVERLLGIALARISGSDESEIVARLISPDDLQDGI